MTAADGSGVKELVGDAATDADVEPDGVAGGVPVADGEPAGVPGGDAVAESDADAAAVTGSRDCVPVGDATVADADDEVVKLPDLVLAGEGVSVVDDDAPTVTDAVAVAVCVPVAVGDASVPATCSR